MFSTPVGAKGKSGRQIAEKKKKNPETFQKGTMLSSIYALKYKKKQGILVPLSKVRKDARNGSEAS